MGQQTETLRLAIDSRGAVVGANAATGAMTRFTKSTALAGTGAKKLAVDMKAAKASALGLAGGLKSLAALAGVAFGFQGIVSATKLFADFELTLQTVGAVTGALFEENQAQFNALKQAARDLGATTQFTAAEAGEGLLFLARAGFTANQAITALPAALDLALAGNIELGESADIASNILAQFSLEVSELSRVTDVLTNTANSANTDIRQLAEAMKLAGPVAGALGLEIEETAAAIGVLGNAGIQGSLAGTNLRGIMAALVGPTTQAKETLEAMGIAIQDVDLNGETLGDVFDLLNEKSLSASEALAIFGRRNVAGALILAENAEAVRQLTAANEEAEGITRRIAAAMEDTLVGKFKSAVSAVQELVLQMTEGGVADGLKTILEVFTNLARALAGNTDQITGNVLTYTRWANIIKETARIVGIFVGVLGSFKAAILAGKLAVAAFSVVIAANPVGLLITAITAAIALMIRFRNETFEFNDRILSINGLVQAVIEEVGPIVRNLFVGIWNGIKVFFVTLWDILKETVGAIWDFIKSIWDMISPFVSDVLNFLKGLFVNIISGVLAMGDTIVGIVEEIIKAASAPFDKLGEAFSNLWEGEFSKAATAFGEALSAFDTAAIGRAFTGAADDLSQNYARRQRQVRGWLNLGQEAATTFGQAFMDELDDQNPELAEAFRGIANLSLQRILDRAAEITAEIQRAREAAAPPEDIQALQAELDTVNEQISDATAELEQGAEALKAILDLAEKISDLKFDFDFGVTAEDMRGLSSSQIEALRRARQLDRDIRDQANTLIERGVQIQFDDETMRAEALDPDDAIATRAVQELNTYRDINVELQRQEELADAYVDKVKEMEKAADRMGESFADAFESAVLGTKSLGEAVRDLGREIAQLVIRQTITAPIAGAISGALQGSGLFTGLFGVPPTAAAGTPTAFGHAFDGGRVQAFAMGGVVDRLTAFGMAGGNLGIMGEAGPEAILPLQRGSDGKLGVAASGEGQKPVTVNINVTSPNADTFKRDDRQLKQIAFSVGTRIQRGG